jgi:Zn-dependent protease with chaperone function
LSTQFFERQEVQRKHTRLLVLAFIAAMLLVIAVIDLLVVLTLGGHPVTVWRHQPEVIVWTSIIVGVVILGSCWHKAAQLRAGGAVVARSLGGVGVGSGETDLARKRLLNIVEEMAIAARIRKPMVFVLPDEEGINAFAAGHSPDEAAIAVTRGALEKLDRDQLQAVIGHEFSHILNGDMQLNMRLTAWIFGLYVITDLALRMLRARGRGKDAGRLKIFAFGVFIAGSVGMFAGRLLQAAVSRRREHLADASAVQFTRNPQALQSAFITMAAHAEGSRLHHAGSADVAHMMFAGSEPAWASKVGGSWFATHPPLEERVRALDNRVTPIRFRTLVSDERRKISARAAQAAPASSTSADVASADSPMAVPGAGIAGVATAAAIAPLESDALTLEPTAAQSAVPSGEVALAETLPSGVRMVGGRALPPDILRNRLSSDQQAAIAAFIARVEQNPLAVQGVFVATMLAAEPAKWRTQLTKLAPALGIELLKETQAQVMHVAQLPAAARLPALQDLLSLLDALEPAHRKRLRAVARAFAPTVATGDMLRFVVTRLLEKKFSKASVAPTPVALHDASEAVCALYSALAQCRFGAGRQGQNSYRAGVMGMLPPKQWAPYPDDLLTPADLDQALAGLARVHPTGKRAFSEGLARVVAVGGRLTVTQVDLLRGTCLLIDCAVPTLPLDVVYEDYIATPQARAL